MFFFKNTAIMANICISLCTFGEYPKHKFLKVELMTNGSTWLLHQLRLPLAGLKAPFSKHPHQQSMFSDFWGFASLVIEN